MLSVKKKWRQFKAYQHIRGLWNEYKKVAQIDDFTLVTSKLNEFLDSFVESYKDLSPAEQGGFKLDMDKIYGDCSEIMLNLLELVEKEAERNSQENLIADLINKALKVADLILHDQKYRVFVLETPNLINRILDLLETLKTTENKKVLLRVISTLGENKENQLEIGRLEGFRKILKLLLDQDKELTTEILRTLKHFLDVQSTDEELTKTVTGSGLSEFFGGKFGTILSDVTKVIVSVFPSRGEEGWEDANPRQLISTTSFIPTAAQIDDAFEELKSGEKQEEERAKASQSEQKREDKMEDLESVPIAEKKDGKAKISEDEILKDLMRMQGTLSVLTSTLQEAALTVQLDLVETISKLLFKNQENQHEFKKIDGYSFFPRLFDKISNFSTKESKLFAEDCFSLFFIVTLDGSQSKRVGNRDALELLFRTVYDSDHYVLKTEALRCAQDILSVNALNAVDVNHVGGVDLLLQAIEKSDSLTLDEEKFLIGVRDLLNYIAVLFSYHDTSIISSYISIAQTHSSEKVKALALQSASKLLGDSINRRSRIPENLLDTSLKILAGLIAKLNRLQDSAQSYEISDLWVEQTIYALEILGLLVKHLEELELFDQKGGFNLLVQVISLRQTISLELMDLALWMLSQFVLATIEQSSNFKHLEKFICLLREKNVSNIVKKQICGTISEFMANHGEASVKAHFCKINGISTLLGILQDPTENKEVMYNAFLAMGEVFTNSEEVKLSFGEIGYTGLSKIIKASQINLDILAFEMCMELALTNGSIRTILGRSQFRYHTPSVTSIISRINLPVALHAEALVCSRNPVEFDLSSLSLSLKDRDNVKQEETETTSTSSSRRSSFSDDDVIFTENGHEDSPEEKFLSRISTFSDSTTSSGVSLNANTMKPPENGQFVLKELTYTDIAKLEFRSADAALMIIELLPASDQSSQQYMLTLMVKLLEANMRNKKIMCDVHGFKLLLDLASSCEEGLQSHYFQLLASLGTYDISPTEARMIFELAYAKNTSHAQRELQMQLLFLIGSISERKTPGDFFAFSGMESQIQLKLAERLPSTKTGYTFCCWLKVNYFKEETGLYSWQDHNERNIFDIYFKTLSSHNGSDRFCLCVQTQNPPSPPQVHVFDRYVFTERGEWHFITVSHSKQKLVLSIDGAFVSDCTLHYPTVVSKERILYMTFGRREHQRKSLLLGRECGHFCGEVGHLHFLEGVLDEAVIQKIYSKGSVSGTSLRGMGVENKEFLSIDPQSFSSQTAIAVATDSPRDPIPLIMSTSPPSSPTSTEQSIMASLTSALNSPIRDVKSGDSILSGVHGHSTRVLRDIIKEIGGVQLCFPFLSMGGAQQVAGLRIITGLLQQSDLTIRHFMEHDGFNIMFYLFSNAITEVTTDTFEVLFELMCDGMVMDSTKPQRSIKHLDCLFLIIDLLHHCDASQQQQLVQPLVNVLVSSPSNISLLLSVREPVSAVDLILDLCLHLSEPTPLLTLLGKMGGSFVHDDVEHIFDFLASEQSPSRLTVKRDIFVMIYDLMQSSMQHVDYFSKLGPFPLIFSIMESPSEEIRIVAIKLIGLLLHSNPRANHAAFGKIFGYDVICAVLSNFPSTDLTYSTLLGFAIGEYQSLGERKTKSWMDIFSSERKDNRASSTFVNPEALRILLQLLKAHEDVEFQHRILRDIERLLTPPNMEILLSQPWFDWFVDFFESFQEVQDDSKIFDQGFNIIQKLMIYDISRKSSQLVKFSELVDYEKFQLMIIEGVIGYYERNATLPSEPAVEIINNLSLLFKSVEEMEDVPALVYKRLIEMLNHLAFENTSVVRTAMKSRGMFDLRDNLIVGLLRTSNAELSSSTESTGSIAEFIFNFDFESIADHKAFKESNYGLVYLLSMYHLCFHNPPLQAVIYEILSNVLSMVDENKRVIAVLFDDSEVSSRFFDHSTDSSSDKGEAPETFTQWYYNAENADKRTEIESKIEKLLLQHEARFANSQKLISQKKGKKSKQRNEKQAKRVSAVSKSIAEWEEKRKGKLGKAQGAFTARQKVVADTREHRFQQGQERWDAVQKVLPWNSSRTVEAEHQHSSVLASISLHAEMEHLAASSYTSDSREYVRT